MRAASRAAAVHLRYLQRDGVTREGSPGQLYSATADRADGRAFLDRSEGDPRQFRLIVAAEDGAELSDLRAFTRDLMRQVERDLGTGLDWVAVDHFNTAHPHTHIVIRGVDEAGENLVIAGAYLAHGIRERASELVTIELGPESTMERQVKLVREIDQKRLTRIDRALLREAGEAVGGVIDLRTVVGEPRSDFDWQLRIGRLQALERLELAEEIATGRWRLVPGMEETLRALGERGDIIKTMHHALTRHGAERGAEQFAIHDLREPLAAPITGRLLGRGLGGDELGDRVHLIVDGLDGRVHYVEVPAAGADATNPPIGAIVELGAERGAPRAADRNIADLAHRTAGIYRPADHLATARADPGIADAEAYVEAHVRRLEALRRADVVQRLDADHWRVPPDLEQRAARHDTGRSQTPRVRVLSALDLEAQIRSDGATWLDRQLLARDPVPLAQGAFGLEVEVALERRRQHHLSHGDARRGADGGVRYHRDLLATLERRELARAGGELAATRAVPFRMPAPGDTIRGTYREAIQLASGRYALVENAQEFTLVPWRPVIERTVARDVVGVVTDGGISWQIGRDRGFGI